MQKVEGSSPFIRFDEKPRKRGAFCVSGRCSPRCRTGPSTTIEYQRAPKCAARPTAGPSNEGDTSSILHAESWVASYSISRRRSPSGPRRRLPATASSRPAPCPAARRSATRSKQRVTSNEAKRTSVCLRCASSCPSQMIRRPAHTHILTRLSKSATTVRRSIPQVHKSLLASYASRPNQPGRPRARRAH